jgi:hypothetical protein
MRIHVSKQLLPFVFATLALCFWALLMPPAANSGGRLEAPAEPAKELWHLRHAKVVCATVREGNQNITYSCPSGHTCFNSGGWKCKPIGIAKMPCTACYNNQKRDSDSCMTTGNDMTKLQCVNRVNADLNKCLSNCQ